ncbi:alpha/beta hydrolase fold domain-containing protein [Streptomyces sp. TS71-3]|uniref:alpha/beta hydrolase fold domain-containing protein n=1 Tax=Streptomyces sp. TS71-3 TaxID=2733862 RepID=UPI001B1ED394|nr:alpha/beta hydrolase fold domain-containing protein [Streptomyces sp. TS71-3]GHJ38955.1 alpha/beta hydrolase [Streptomyces sp. TS71-3]
MTGGPAPDPAQEPVTDPAHAWALAAQGRAPLAAGTVRSEVIHAGRPAVRVRPGTGGRRGTLLHLHGGGYRAGSPRVSEGAASFLAAELDAEVLLPAYRLAGERPFPAAVEDATAAYRSLLESGVDPGRLAVLGDSAGGGLAAAALLAAQDAGLPRPAALVGLSPWYDLTVTAGSYERCRGTDTVLSRASMRDSAARYLAGADPRTPLASPLFAQGAALRGLPPVLVQCGGLEVLADDAGEFARRVDAAGGRAVHRSWAGQGHCWHLAVPGLPAAREAVAATAAFLDVHLV